jgi:hypothetical protein
MGLNWGRVAAAVATGGMSEVAIETTQAAAAVTAAVAGGAGDIVGGALGGLVGGGGTAAQAGGAGGGCSGTTASAGGGLNITTCCRYQFHGDLLLDTQTGAVWKYDSKLSSLFPVERERDVFRKGLEVAGLLRALGALEKDFKGLPKAEKSTYQDVFDSLHLAASERKKGLLLAIGPTPIPKVSGKKPARPRAGK